MTAAATRALGHLDRRLDHRQREALDAEAVESEVARSARSEPSDEHVRLAVVGEQIREALSVSR